jgi:hypothetical protein
MTTPFDQAITAIALAGYHNHRLEAHSDIVSLALYTDLLATCPPLRADIESGVVGMWLNVRAPGDRLRKVDLVVGEVDASGRPDIERIRIALENNQCERVLNIPDQVRKAYRGREPEFDRLVQTRLSRGDALPLPTAAPWSSASKGMPRPACHAVARCSVLRPSGP